MTLLCGAPHAAPGGWCGAPRQTGFLAHSREHGGGGRPVAPQTLWPQVPDMTRPTRGCLGQLSCPAGPVPQGGREPQSPELWACGLLVTQGGIPWGEFAHHTEGAAVPAPVIHVSRLCPVCHTYVMPVSYMKPQPGTEGPRDLLISPPLLQSHGEGAREGELVPGYWARWWLQVWD